MKLQTLDVLVNINPGKSAWDKVSRWAVGPYNHVSLYLGLWLKADLETYTQAPFEDIPEGKDIMEPMITESIGRGRLLRSLEERYGEKVKVMRFKPGYLVPSHILFIMGKAIRLSGKYDGWYGYDDIVRDIPARILSEKLGWRFPCRWVPDTRPICSEHVAEILTTPWMKILAKLPTGWIPVPGDFVHYSPYLYDAGDVILGPEVI